MQECKQNAQDCAHRLVLRPAHGGEPGIGQVGASAQEVPSRSAAGAPFARAFRAALAGSIDERFARLNPADGRVVAPRMRPSGVLWRFHPSLAATDPEGGAAVAPRMSGALA